MAKEIPVLTYFLEMKVPSQVFVSPPDRNLHILQLYNPKIEYYRFLYQQVGESYNWVDRNMMHDEELSKIITHQQVDIYVLYDGGSPAGFVELDFRKEKECELAYFGLLKAFQGIGLGKYFLNWSIRKAWDKEIDRLCVHTCEWDHPSALSVYQRAGFKLYEEKRILQTLP